MASATRHSIVITLSITLLIVQWGCAHAPPQPLSEEVRATLGTIGVVLDATHEMKVKAPTSGKAHGAAKGASTGILRGALEGLNWGRVFFITVPVFAAVGGTIGFGVGAFKAKSWSEVKETEAALTKALGELKVQETIRDRVLKEARDNTRHTFVLVEDRVPYSSLADKGIDTILEIGVVGLRFEGKGINPTLALDMSVRARLIRVSDGTELYSDKWTFNGTRHKFTEWAVNNAQIFRIDVDRACQSLAYSIVWTLFRQFSAKVESNTALIGASMEGRTATVKALLEAGADVNAKAKDGWTALIWAAKKGHTETVRTLLEAEADVNAKDKYGTTALVWAAEKGYTETVKALLEAGADVNAKENWGWTALMVAATLGSTETVKALLKAGADVNAKHKEGKTALMYAEEKGYTEIVQLLKRAGAKE